MENDVLLMADLGAKSEWFDLNQARFLVDRNSISLFNKIVTRLKVNLPYFVRNRQSGNVIWHRTRVRHSVGVVDWVKSGGKINQFGVVNIDFTIDQAAEQSVEIKVPQVAIRRPHPTKGGKS